jgi:DNA-binding response OmpR family regulator
MRHEPYLLIIDNREIYDAMAPVLSRHLGTTHLIHCDNYNSALEIIKSDLRLDLIFADWQLTGAEFIDAVRADLENHNTPLIVLSGEDNRLVEEVVLRHGATDWLTKPFLNKALTHKIDTIFASRERRRRSRIHPERRYPLQVNFANGTQIELDLLDFSFEACLGRGPAVLCQQICIYEEATMRLNVEEFDVTLDGCVERIERDPAAELTKDKILIMLRFRDSHEDRLDKLRDMLDELVARW